MNIKQHFIRHSIVCRYARLDSARLNSISSFAYDNSFIYMRIVVFNSLTLVSLLLPLVLYALHYAFNLYPGCVHLFIVLYRKIWIHYSSTTTTTAIATHCFSVAVDDDIAVVVFGCFCHRRRILHCLLSNLDASWRNLTTKQFVQINFVPLGLHSL